MNPCHAERGQLIALNKSNRIYSAVQIPPPAKSLFYVYATLYIILIL